MGKTEIARRLARLARAPFIKVEATKFTEVGYVGREVDSIIKDLMDVAVKMTREEEMEKVRHRAMDAAEERVLDALLPRPKSIGFSSEPEATPRDAETRQKFRKMLREGQLDEREIEVDVRALPVGVEIMAPAGMEELTTQLQSMFSNLGGTRTRPRKVKVREAFKLLTDEEAAKMINEEELKLHALANAEQNGIVFIDEIDKIARRQETQGADVSREGVQRDLLPLVEGSTVSTKHGVVKTDHILFIASGAFHMSKPSDLIPELQGRFPIRVELDALKVEDFIRILTEPDASLCTQYSALVAHRGREPRVRSERRAPHRRSRLPGERAHREHWCATTAHRARTIARSAVVRSRGPRRPRRDDRRAVRRPAPRRAGQGRRPDPLHPLSAPMPHPTSIKSRTRSRLLEVTFDDGSHYQLPFEYLRVYSPSADVRGHGPGQETLQLGKHEVGLTRIEPVGHYAVRLVFDDGHDTGLYTWAYLHELGREQPQKWQQYLDRLRELNIPYPTPAAPKSPLKR